jgi:hypothetical protein
MPGRWRVAVPVGAPVRYSAEVSKTLSVIAGASRRTVAPPTLALLVAAVLTPPASVALGWGLVEASVVTPSGSGGDVLVNSTLTGIALGMALTVAAFLLQIVCAPSDA